MFQADQTGMYRWPLVRVEVHGETEIVLLSQKFLPLTVHWSRRSMLCAGDNCALCSWLPARGLYYVACICSGRVSMLELASLSSSYLQQHCKLLHGGMRAGLKIRLSRSSRKAPVHGEVVGELSGVVAVEVSELAPRVMALYQMPGPNPDEAFEIWESRLCQLAQRRAEAEVKRLSEGVAGRVAGR